MHKHSQGIHPIHKGQVFLAFSNHNVRCLQDSRLLSIFLLSQSCARLNVKFHQWNVHQQNGLELEENGQEVSGV